MSTLKVTIVTLDVESHPNADRLDLCKPRGMLWTCVSGKGNFKSGDLAIYFPVDSVLPDKLVKDLDIEKYYHKRLKTTKLRNVISQGLVAPLSILPPNTYDLEKLPAPGDDVTERLGITKYEPPPPPANMSGVRLPSDERFQKYTEIENIKNFPDVFKLGESVIITEKLHGSNGRALKIDGKLLIGSHNCNLKEDENNLYWKAAKMLNMSEKLQEGDQLFFEVYGSGVQDLTYGKKNGEISVGIFDLIKGGKYLNYNEFVPEIVAREWFNYLVPSVAITEWKPELVKLAEGKSLIDPTQIREGVVIKPLFERYDSTLQGRTILKAISDEYLSRKDRSEFH